MEDIKFKEVTTNDWEVLEELEKGANSSLYCACKNEAQTKKYIKESKVYFIMDKDKIIGSISYKTEKNGSRLINGLTVIQEYQNKGAATSAMKKLLIEGEKQMWTLYVHPGNTPALLIYLRLGFVISKWVDDHFGDGEPRLFLKKVQ